MRDSRKHEAKGEDVEENVGLDGHQLLVPKQGQRGILGHEPLVVEFQLESHVYRVEHDLFLHQVNLYLGVVEVQRHL